MNYKILLAKITLILIVGSSVALPVAAHAAVDAAGNPVSYQQPSLWPTGFWAPNGLVSCTGNYPISSSTPSGGAYCNNLCDLIGTIINVIYFAITIAIFIITPIIFLVGAIMVMVSGAKPEMRSTGKRILLSTVIGLTIVLCSYLIVATVVKVLGITGVGGFGSAICTSS